MLVLKLICAVLLIVWLVLVLLGKGGFVHILLLNALGIAAVVVMTQIRTWMTA